MRSRCLAFTLLALAQLALLQSACAFQNPDNEQQLAIRREHFTSGRQLLLEKGVPFDPDELLKGGWDKRLKTTLDSIPEMHQVRRHSGPLNGVQMADTLYLPEQVELSGDTVIVAKYIVFEGTHPVIKGSHDLSVFPGQPIVVLGTTVAELMRKRPGLVNVSLKNGNGLPSFALIQDLRQGWKHITFDTSGPETQRVRKPTNKVQPTIRGASFHLPLPFLMQSQNTSGGTGQTGTSGTTPPQSAPGDSPAKAANGSCGGTFNGQGGTPGGNGAPGQNGGAGGQGGPGGNASNIIATIPDGDFNTYSFIADGGSGGLGGAGGNGGMGGNGGRGGDGGDGVACGCQVGDGGDAAHGGNGAVGGNGGNGGVGGTGGNGGSISVSLPAGSPGATTSNSGGPGGRGGDAGVGGIGGNAGPAGNPGSGAVACGNSGAVGLGNFGGDAGASGNPGTPGAFGPAGAAGPPPSVTFRQASTGGGGGGPLPDPCLNSATVQGPTGELVSTDCSPIIVDTTGQGFHLTSAADGVLFDIAGTGNPLRIGWTAAGSGNAFLALPGSNGLVNDGRQLFGNFTPQPSSATPNGFLALAVYDQPDHGGNGDGVIDENDQIFSSLRLWIDANHDGVCQPEELHTLPEQGVLAIALNYTESGRTDQYGNRFRFKAKVNPRLSGNADVGRSAYDVFLTGR